MKLDNAILSMFSEQAVISAIEKNAIEGIEAWRCWSGLTLHENSQVTWGQTVVPYPIFNNILRFQVQSDEVDGVLERIKSHNIPLRCWVGPSTHPIDMDCRLEADGWTRSLEGTGMAINLSNLCGDMQQHSDIMVEEVLNIKMLQEWAFFFAETLDLPHVACQEWYNVHASMFLSGKSWRHFHVTISGRLVAIGSIFNGTGVAGIANIVSLSEVRRRGIGSALVLHLLAEAHRSGYLTGTLISTPAACGMYRRIGFNEFYKCIFFTWSPKIEEK